MTISALKRRACSRTAACWISRFANCRAAAEEDKGNWLPAETARMYEDAGRYDIAVETLKRAIPNYFALDMTSLPRPLLGGIVSASVLD